MKPIVAYLKGLGSRLLAYVDDLFEATLPFTATHAIPADTKLLGVLMHTLFTRLGMRLHPTKILFAGRRKSRFSESWWTLCVENNSSLQKAATVVIHG